METNAPPLAVFKLICDIVEGLEGREHVPISLCDLSKAFDCVSHEILLDKLSFYGIQCLPLNLFYSYLNNRQQCVTIDNKISELLPVKHGMPQGSVLVLLLFILYVTCVAHADDTSIIGFNLNIDILAENSARSP